jgi:hypothetical protein
LGFTRENSKLAQEIQVDSSGRVQINGASGTYVANIADASNAFLGFKSGSNSVALVGQDSNGDAYLQNNHNATLRFGTNNTERARIDSSGNLLVGTTNASDSQFHLYRTTSSGQVARITNATGSTGVAYISFRYGAGGTETGYISTNGSTTSYVTTSDYRLKKDVQPMTGALSRIAALKPCVYKWKATGETDEGFIAHELAEVCPSAVTGEKDAVNEDGSIKPQGIDTSFLVATLTAAIQEQQAMIEELMAKVAALES